MKKKEQAAGAANDGVVNAAGTPKQTTLANLNLDEGLRILVKTLTWNPNKRWTLLARAGAIKTAADSAQNSKNYRKEFDFGAIHQLSPSATVSFDFGHFVPGAFFVNRTAAELFSLKYELSF